MKWPWTRRGVESRSYTDAVVSALLDAAAGGAAMTASATGAMETASGLWARAFASATVTPAGAAALLTPELLAYIGRQLCRGGNGLLYIDVRGDGPVLRPVSQLNVWGGVDRSTWRYDFELAAPGGSWPMVGVASDDMVHVRYSYTADAPWRGLGPMEWATVTGRMAGAMEQRLEEESKSPVGYLLPVPKPPTGAVADAQGNLFDPMESLKVALKGLKGNTALVETLQAMAGDGTHRVGGSSADWTPRRLGSNPPPTVIGLRDEAERSVLAACGIPPGLAGTTQSQGTQAREDWRRFLHGTIAPVGEMVRAEMAEKLPWPDITIGFDRLFASDLSGRARAFQSLVGGGMDATRAAGLAGLMEGD